MQHKVFIFSFYLLSFLSVFSIISAMMSISLFYFHNASMERLCKSRMGCMRLLCIVQSRMQHHAAFVSLSMMYLILA
jgi:hypothetical protein